MAILADLDPPSRILHRKKFMNIEYDIKEILTDIKQSFDKIDARFEKLETKIDKIAENVAELKGDVKVLDEKIDGLGKRLDQTEFINRGVIVGLVLTIVGGFVKIFGLK